MNRRVVVTGIGMVTALGNTAADTWEGIKNGINGIGQITTFDTAENKVKIAAEVKIDVGEYIPRNESRRMDRFTQLAIIAANEAFADSEISADNVCLKRCGTIVSSGIGGMLTHEKEHSKGLEKGFDRVSPFFIPATIIDIAAGYIAINTGFKGYAVAPVAACAGGSYAIGDAMRQIRHGYLDVVLCGGSEAAITPLALGGFTSMKALNETNNINRASIPFDKERSGFVMGEGAGMLMLEEFEHAKKRGAKIYAEVMGYGASCDAYHITAPGGEGETAMRTAIEDAGLLPSDIEYINAHGTSTPLNDKCETESIRNLFSENLPIVSSTKSMTGHTLGAAGAIEGIFCALALRDGFIPPTINYEKLDEDCNLDVVPNIGRAVKIKCAMSNSFGFGGHNASLVFGRV